MMKNINKLEKEYIVKKKKYNKIDIALIVLAIGMFVYILAHNGAKEDIDSYNLCIEEDRFEEQENNFKSHSEEGADKNITNTTKLIIIMYHSIQKDKKYVGRYIIDVDTFENDIKYFLSMGYESVNTKDLINYVDNNSTLPSKAVMFTFDDGHYNFATNVYPILEKYDIKAVVGVVGKYINDYERNYEKNDRYSYLTWEDMSKIASNSKIEFQNHSYDMHEINMIRYGIKEMYNETEDAYERRFINDTNKLSDEMKINVGIAPTTYVYPFGMYTRKSENMLRKIGYKVTLSCREGINCIERNNPESLYVMRRYNREYSIIGSEEYFKKIIG